MRTLIRSGNGVKRKRVVVEMGTQLVIAAALLAPLSVTLWVLCLSVSLFKADHIQLSPIRCVVAIIAPLFISKWGLSRGSLDKSGAIAGILVGFVLTFSNFCFFSSLLTFFVLGSKVTKFRSQQKKKLEDDFKEGGQRNWIQVLCNGGIAAEFALLYLIDAGSRECVINLQKDYNASWYCLATLGSLCCSCGDTFSSEIGSVIGKSDPRLITNFQKVPKGTNGGVSFVGTLASIIGGALVGLAYFLTLIVLTPGELLSRAPPQWVLIPVGGLLGLLGSIVDSLLGATLQYSGFDKKTGRVVSQPGPGVEPITGSHMLDNHGVNVVAALITGILSPNVALLCWKNFM